MGNLKFERVKEIVITNSEMGK